MLAVLVFFEDEGFDLPVLYVAGPDYYEVGEGGVADPTLLAVDDPAIPVAPCVVSSITESEPWSASVRPQAPIFSIRAISGSHRLFCSSEPQMAMVPIASPEWTPKNVLNYPSPRAISMAHSPAATWLMPGHP